MKIVGPEVVHARMVAELGLDPAALDLTSVEAIAQALRRAAGLFCPCTAATLVRGVVNPLEGLVDDSEKLRECVEDTLDALVAHGDLLELAEIDSNAAPSGKLFYAAAPAFVRRQSGSVLVLGLVPDQGLPLPEEMEHRIEYANHVRRIAGDRHESLPQTLLELGFLELSYETWSSAPVTASPSQHLQRHDDLLSQGTIALEIPGLVVLDPARTPTYYRGRWREVTPAMTGRLVGRRRQAYGADVWCYVELHNGAPRKLLDLPVAGSRWRGCDEAWMLQAAIDFVLGQPQRLRSRPGPQGTVVLDFFSPVPTWAHRRWSAMGDPVATSGCLFSYALPDRESREEIEFARERLWLAPLSDRRGR
jgi:hypothetical protein